MEFRQLEYFVAVAEEQSFAKAAVRLHISQPAISRQVQLLEQELRVALFDPVQKLRHKRVVLTEEGSYLYQEAVRMLRQSSEVAEGLQRLRTRRRTAQLGYTVGLPQAGLVAALEFISDRIPDIDWALTPFPNVQDMLEAVRKDEIHFATALDLGHIPGGLDGVTVLEGRVQVCVAQEHPLASRSCLALENLPAEEWIASPLPFPEKNGFRVPVGFDHLLALIALNKAIGAVPSFYKWENARLRQVNLEVSGEEIPCRQSVLFRKGNRSGLVRKLVTPC